MRSNHLLAILALFLPLLGAPAVAENWPHWRGPHLDSTTGETGLPTTWSSGEGGEKNVRWRYLSGENGKLTVLDAHSGETVYAERVHQSQHRGSPVLADGKLYLTATDGTVSVLRAGRSFELLAKNKIDGGRLAASPAISGGTIYLRSYDALFAIAQQKARVAER